MIRGISTSGLLPSTLPLPFDELSWSPGCSAWRFRRVSYDDIFPCILFTLNILMGFRQIVKAIKYWSWVRDGAGKVQELEMCLRHGWRWPYVPYRPAVVKIYKVVTGFCYCYFTSCRYCPVCIGASFGEWQGRVIPAETVIRKIIISVIFQFIHTEYITVVQTPDYDRSFRGVASLHILRFKKCAHIP